jgi:putative Holliday junction resolvase
MKTLGIDYGRRRIGIAVTDESGTCIKGRPTIDQKKYKDIHSVIASVISSESPDIIVFGVPLGPDDQETVMSKEIRKFAKKISNKINSDIEIHFIDESYSSSKAHNQLLFKKKKQRQNKDIVNMFAACNIIESFQRLQKCGPL